MGTTSRRIWLAMSAALAPMLMAQAPPSVKLDTPQVRVLAVTAAPHRPSPLVERPNNRVMIYLDAGQVSWTGASGKVEKFAFKVGEARWSPAGEPYKNENLTDHPVRIVEIALKNPAGAPLPASKLDPVLVEPKHYQVDFENDYVRVLRIRYGAREKGALHEHQLNRVVVYLTDHSNAKAGEVHLSGPATHTEETPSISPWSGSRSRLSEVARRRRFTPGKRRPATSRWLS